MTTQKNDNFTWFLILLLLGGTVSYYLTTRVFVPNNTESTEQDRADSLEQAIIGSLKFDCHYPDCV